MNLRAPRIPLRHNPARNDFTVTSILLMFFTLLVTIFRNPLGNLFASDRGISATLIKELDQVIAFDKEYRLKTDLTQLYSQRNTVRDMLLDIAADPLMTSKLTQVLNTPNFKIIIVDNETLERYGLPAKTYQSGAFLSQGNILYLTADSIGHFTFKQHSYMNYITHTFFIFAKA